MALNIKYRPLKAFLLAVQTKSFTHAASLLGVTQPSFTALIADLESVLEVKLFERTTRQISLTAAGVEFRDRIERPMADLEEAYRSMQDLASVRRGAVVIGALPSTSLTLVPPALGALRQQHPKLQIRVVEAHNDELIAMLRTNQIEFALATLLSDAPDLKFSPLVADAFFAVYPSRHPVGQLPSLHWEDLTPLDLVLLAQGSSARHQFDRAVISDKAATGLRYDVTHMTTAVRLVSQGLGVAVLPRLALPSLGLGSLRSRPIEDESARRTIGVLHRQDRLLSPAAQALVDTLRQAAVEIEQALPPLAQRAAARNK
ncbi:Transcriptional regulator, LysR family [plant metagenome]|uniref:Transcriptional regulator, LysR family n=2 Tax=root TaxID=1 RepID=A0A1C3K7L7_9BURK|nr:LysR family transcriptional regulator [Orrella dioscoreae]SBT27519.1 Transcriptional regulator, LysR family [Orrella dioscoreae]SOE48145.1 Transcriptional regulator, LysR family [Orrella dioscoreae]